MGQLKHMYVNLLRPVDKTAVAKNLNLTAPVLKSWMATYVRVRNICAHHGRLWNVGLGVYPRIPSSSTIPWLDRSRQLCRTSHENGSTQLSSPCSPCSPPARHEAVGVSGSENSWIPAHQ
ncbi:Abi family protein [Paraoerskovia marina]|uniref:Abi family protein n=1 Tax=Paraoerskovia marina TaxID=545619 RepID=UPI0038B22DE5